jgi:hypothetical protein
MEAADSIGALVKNTPSPVFGLRKLFALYTGSEDFDHAQHHRSPHDDGVGRREFSAGGRTTQTTSRRLGTLR